MTSPALDLFFAIRPDDEHVELLLAEIDDENPLAVEDRPNGIRVFFSNEIERGRAAVRLIAVDPSIECVPVEVDDDDWAARSQSALTPVRVGRLLIIPITDDDAKPDDRRSAAEADSLSIFIRPSMGFGTGHHASTRLCLALLQDVVLDGRRVLDVGAGSAVLAIAAWRLGATTVVAIDRDNDAVDSARANVGINGAGDVVSVENIGLAEFQAGSTSRFDLVLANLTGASLVRHQDALARCATPDGRLIVSGLLAEEEPSVIDRFAAGGWRVEDRKQEDEWIGIRFAATTPTSSTASSTRRAARSRRGGSAARG